jgi:hypothetical protein
MRAEPRWYRIAVAVVLVLLAAILLWNAYAFNHERGYDGPAHIRYADYVSEEHRIPGKDYQGYYSPPLFYALAGFAMRLAEPHITVEEKVVQGMNAVVVFATALLLLATVRLLFPGRRVLHLAALAGFALVPVVTRTGAMFHPEPLDMLVSLAGLHLAARMLVHRRLDARHAIATGLALGLAQLVRQFGLYALGAVVLAFGAAALWRLAPRRRTLAMLAVVVATTAATTAPWYVYQASRFSNPIFDQPQPDEPLWKRRPLSFYVDPGLPELFTDPARPSFVNRFFPTAYSELWGDYFGIWTWNAALAPQPDAAELRELRLQAIVGVAPTILSLVGLAAALAAVRRRPEVALFGFHAVLGALGLLYFAIAYPTIDGDTIKATFMVAATPAWAICFGLGAERAIRRLLPLGSRVVVPVAAFAGALVLADVCTIVYG